MRNNYMSLSTVSSSEFQRTFVDYSRTRKRISKLPFRMQAMMAVYIFSVFSFGQFAELRQSVIWGGGTVIMGLVLMWYLKKPTALPVEILLYFCLIIWAVSGYSISPDRAAFVRYFRLMVQILVLMSCFVIVTFRSGTIGGFLWAMVAASGFQIGYVMTAGGFAPALTSSATDRLAGMTGNANDLGWLVVSGLMAAAFLWYRQNKVIGKAILVSYASVAFYVLILTASRKSFLTVVIFVIAWQTPVIRRLLRKYPVLIVPAVMFFFVVGYLVLGSIVQRTYLGERLTRYQSVEDIGQDTRAGLYAESWEMFLQSPIIGKGLGQFRYYSRKHLIAHSDYGELLATTGIVGFALFVGFYCISLRKTSKLLSVVAEPKARSDLLLIRALIVSLIFIGFGRPNFVSISSMAWLAVGIGYVAFIEKCWESGLLSSYKSVLSAGISRPGVPVGVARAVSRRNNRLV